MPKRLAAVRAFAALPEAASLAAANKRVGNILKKAEGGVEAERRYALAQRAGRAALAKRCARSRRRPTPPSSAATTPLRCSALAALKTPVDAFFDGVMVNADDPALRANRLGLLATLHAAMNRVADLSKLAV